MRPLLPNGKPRAALPADLEQRVRRRHVLVYQAGIDERHPGYADDLLVVRGFLLPWIKHWVAHYRSDTTRRDEFCVRLWEGERMGVEIIAAETPQACAAVLAEHLAAWGYEVEIVLAEQSDVLEPTRQAAAGAAPERRQAQPALF
ncbi:MAG: hypothetical protein JW850_18495 [Thermoflexales bacterium]|nr:hypothetical protein [Thermoflexales bacterium]